MLLSSGSGVIELTVIASHQPRSKMISSSWMSWWATTSTRTWNTSPPRSAEGAFTLRLAAGVDTDAVEGFLAETVGQRAFGHVGYAAIKPAAVLGRPSGACKAGVPAARVTTRRPGQSS